MLYYLRFQILIDILQQTYKTMTVVIYWSFIIIALILISVLVINL